MNEQVQTKHPSKRKSLYVGIAVAIILVIIIVLSLPIVPLAVPYKEIVPTEVPVRYKKTCTCYDTLLHFTDWEIACDCRIENIDSEGGTFTVVAKYYDKGNLVYTTSDSKYIGPGQSATFHLVSHGLGFSTDWQSRYSVYVDVEPPTKIEQHVVTKYKTEYVSILWLLMSGGRP